MNNYNILLKMQEPIDFYDICTIYQPSFGEILQYKIPKFEQLLLPYCITIDSLNTELSEEEKNQIKNFDIVVHSPDVFEIMINSLEFFCKSKVSVDKDGIFFEGFIGRLNRDNWDEFSEIILDICARKRPEKEKIPIFKAQKDTPEYEEALQRWKLLQDGRKRSMKQNEVKLEDVLNIVHLGGKLYISKREIKEFTLWEIMNVYKSKIGISNYEDSFSIYLVSGEKSLIEYKHWTDLIKIEYKPKE